MFHVKHCIEKICNNCNCSGPAPNSKNRLRMLAFGRLFSLFGIGRNGRKPQTRAAKRRATAQQARLRPAGPEQLLIFFNSWTALKNWTVEYKWCWGQKVFWPQVMPRLLRCFAAPAIWPDPSQSANLLDSPANCYLLMFGRSEGKIACSSKLDHAISPFDLDIIISE